MKKRNTIAVVLTIIGLLQIAGYLLNSMPLRGLGVASMIAPFPKVFCAVDGYEAFSCNFTLEGKSPDSSPWTLRITPEDYARLTGPYNRRNVYGAALAGGPILPDDLRDQVLSASLDPGSAMRTELGVPEDITDLGVVIRCREGNLIATY